MILEYRIEEKNVVVGIRDSQVKSAGNYDDETESERGPDVVETCDNLTGPRTVGILEMGRIGDGGQYEQEKTGKEVEINYNGAECGGREKVAEIPDSKVG